MPVISFPRRKQPTLKIQTPQGNLQSTLFTNINYATKTEKMELLRELLQINFNGKSLDQIKLFCQRELKAISCIVDAAGNEDKAYSNLIDFFNEKDNVTPTEHIGRLLSLFKNRNSGFIIGQQNLNRSAAIYFEILCAIVEIDNSEFSPHERENINIAQKESNKWYRENYAKNIRVKKNFALNKLVIDLNSADKITRNNLIIFEALQNSANPQNFEEVAAPLYYRRYISSKLYTSYNSKQENLTFSDSQYFETFVEHKLSVFFPFIKELTVTNITIQKIPNNAFRGMFSLLKINFSQTNLTNLTKNTFCGLEGLEEIDLSHNRLVKIEANTFVGLQRLRKLNLSMNQISEINDDEFKGLGNLQVLNLSHNKLINIKANIFLDLGKLRKLNLYANQISEINDEGFKGLDSLEVLILRMNKLTTVSKELNKLTRLLKLDLSRNEIKEIYKNSFYGLRNLRLLDLSSETALNVIYKKAFNGLDNLLILWLGMEPQLTFEDPLYRLANLQILKSTYIHTRNSKISELVESAQGFYARYIEGERFIRYLQKIVIKTNYFDYIKESSNMLNDRNYDSLMEALNRTDYSEKAKQKILDVYNSQSLELDLSNCQLTEPPNPQILSFLPFIQTLILANNKIKELKTKCFSKLCNLQKLDLRLNIIRAIPKAAFYGLANLKILWLDNNCIITISKNGFNGLNCLEILNLERNCLTCIQANTFSPLINLRELYLIDNSLRVISENAFNRLINLQQLYLQGSFKNLRGLPLKVFSSLISLRKLNLSYNNFTSIKPNTFNGLGNLEDLELYFSKIEKIEKGAFNGLDNLLYLNLSGNELTKVDKDCFSGLLNLKQLFLTSNSNLVFEKDIFNSLASLRYIKFNQEQKEKIQKTILNTRYYKWKFPDRDFAIVQHDKLIKFNRS